MIYVVMFFDTEFNLGVSSNPNKWINYKNIRFNNGYEALYTFINADCFSPQIIKGENDQIINEKINQMKLNYTDNSWVNDNVYNNL